MQSGATRALQVATIDDVTVQTQYELDAYIRSITAGCQCSRHGANMWRQSSFYGPAAVWRAVVDKQTATVARLPACPGVRHICPDQFSCLFPLDANFEEIFGRCEKYADLD